VSDTSVGTCGDDFDSRLRRPEEPHTKLFGFPLPERIEPGARVDSPDLDGFVGACACKNHSGGVKIKIVDSPIVALEAAEEFSGLVVP